MGENVKHYISDNSIQEILKNTSQFFKDTIIDFSRDISAGYEQEGNSYDKIFVDFLDERLKKMTGSLSE